MKELLYWIVEWIAKIHSHILRLMMRMNTILQIKNCIFSSLDDGNGIHFCRVSCF